jgi:hypothetical protein
LIVIGVSKGQGIPETKVTFNSKNGKAGIVIADPLTKKSGNTTGSRPSVNPAGWREHIMTIPGYERDYVRLHLLNDHLHGPGNEPLNLTPGRKSENTSMEQQAETPAWRLMIDNAVLWYEAEITSYRSNPGFEYFAEGVRISYGLKEKGADGEWRRVGQTSYNNIFSITEPDSIGNREMVPTIDTMPGRHWDVMAETSSSANTPSREVFRQLVNGRSSMPGGRFKNWNTFINSAPFKIAEKSSPGLQVWFQDAIAQNKVRNI